MDKKSKILSWLMVGLIVGSIIITYWRIIIKRDYVIESQIDCDPYADRCFIWECNPQSATEDEVCVGDPEQDIWYYQIVRRNASKIPLCDPEADESCDLWLCDENETDCASIFCDETNKTEQNVECSDPIKYIEENPIEAETEMSDSEDEEISE